MNWLPRRVRLLRPIGRGRGLGLGLGLGLLLGGLGCHARPTPEPSPPSAPSERDVLLARIGTLDEVEPCLVDAGASALRLVDAEVAGDAATVTFTCANGAASGKVTFFRVAGTWTISTKAIVPRGRP